MARVSQRWGWCLALALTACLDLPSPDKLRFVCEHDCEPEPTPHAGDTNDAGRFDAGLGCQVECNAAAPACLSASVLCVERVRACAGFVCQLEVTDVTCRQGCVDNLCVGEPCAGLTCDAPPPASCVSNRLLQGWLSPGTCSEGSCGYDSMPIDCPFGCEAGACVGDPCAGKQCSNAPPQTCIGNVLRTFEAQGFCSDATGCSYASHDTACPEGCNEGACLYSPCLGVTCTQPPAATCVDASTRERWTGGTCHAADGGTSCSYSSVFETCLDDEVCLNGACVTPPPACTPDNCEGCCVGAMCKHAGAQSDALCGSGGAACRACGAGYACGANACLDINECLTNNGGCHANASCTNTAGSRTCRCKTGFSGDGFSCAPVAFQWRNVTPDGGLPAARIRHSMTYDSARRVLVLFGGETTQGVNETWERSDAGWALRPVVGTWPVARLHSAMVFDSTRNRSVIFGGRHPAQAN